MLKYLNFAIFGELYMCLLAENIFAHKDGTCDIIECRNYSMVQLLDDCEMTGSTQLILRFGTFKRTIWVHDQIVFDIAECEYRDISKSFKCHLLFSRPFTVIMCEHDVHCIQILRN